MKNIRDALLFSALYFVALSSVYLLLGGYYYEAPLTLAAAVEKSVVPAVAAAVGFIAARTW